MLHNSFLQKFVLCAFIGMVLAGGIQFYRHIIQAGDNALNGKYRAQKEQILDVPTMNQGAAPRRK